MKKLALALVLLAFDARAADMVECGKQASGHIVYPLAGESCSVICSGIGTGAGGTITTCPVVKLPANIPSFNQMTFMISSGASNCTTGTFTIRWHPNCSAASPGVPQTAATLTGLTSTDTSSVTISNAVGPCFDATFTPTVDTDCDANGGVDLVVKTKQVKP